MKTVKRKKVIRPKAHQRTRAASVKPKKTTHAKARKRSSISSSILEDGLACIRSPKHPKGLVPIRASAHEEGLAHVLVPEGVFFNPHMRLCRSLSSLWVGTLPRVEKALDAFCASGIRGLRYKLENENVESVTFLDLSEKAVEMVKRNLALNKLPTKKNPVVREEMGRFLSTRSDFALIEIDPFGSPAPHLQALMRAGYRQDVRYVSITATDMAVLCGAHAAACWKNYGAKAMDNEFCHENALRILLGRVARAAAEENWAIYPQFCYSHRHYLKLLLKLERGAPGAVECAKESMKYAVHCPKCLYHAIQKFPTPFCPHCSKGGECEERSSSREADIAPLVEGRRTGRESPSLVRLDWAGPLWGGAWADAKVVGRMQAQLQQRPYLEQKELAALLQTIANELGGPALHYDLHELASKHHQLIPQTDDIMEQLRASGFFASRTHFSPTAMRTNAPLDEIIRHMKSR